MTLTIAGPRVTILKTYPLAFWVGLLQVVAATPVWIWFCRRLNDGSDEPLGLLTLVLALVLGWRDRKSLWAGAAFRIVGALLVLASVVATHTFPPMLRAMLAVAGIGICYGFHRRAGLLGLLLLSLPLIASMQFFLGYPLQWAAAEGAVKLLQLASLVTFRSGTQIELAGQVIGVDPACSGVRMLWHAVAAGMALAAIHRLSWRATIAGGLLAVALVIPANSVRAALLAIKETGYLPECWLGHGTIGLLSFTIVLVPLWLILSGCARPVTACAASGSTPRLEIWLLAVAAVLTPVFALAPSRVVSPLDFPPLPELYTFGGITLPLQQLAPTELEAAFARSFPGRLSSNRWGDRQVILRCIRQASRQLHPTRDCLRAAGFATTEAVTVAMGDGMEWAKFHATRSGEQWTVHERIISASDGSSWTDVSAWYWSALRHPLNGPWQAETVISR